MRPRKARRHCCWVKPKMRVGSSAVLLRVEAFRLACLRRGRSLSPDLALHTKTAPLYWRDAMRDSRPCPCCTDRASEKEHARRDAGQLPQTLPCTRQHHLQMDCIACRGCLERLMSLLQTEPSGKAHLRICRLVSPDLALHTTAAPLCWMFVMQHDCLLPAVQMRSSKKGMPAQMRLTLLRPHPTHVN